MGNENLPFPPSNNDPREGSFCSHAMSIKLLPDTVSKVPPLLDI
jgi:hypothetical protein